MASYKDIQKDYNKEKFLSKYVQKIDNKLVVKDCRKDERRDMLIEDSELAPQHLWECLTFEIYSGQIKDEIIEDLRL